MAQFDPDLQSNMQGNYGPTPAAPVQPPAFQTGTGGKSNKGLWILIIILIVLLLGVSVGAFLLFAENNKKKPAATQTPTTEQTSTNQALKPATALSTEQANSAISQEISSPNDDHDFPATQLSDDTLKL